MHLLGFPLLQNWRLRRSGSQLPGRALIAALTGFDNAFRMHLTAFSVGPTVANVPDAIGFCAHAACPGGGPMRPCRPVSLAKQIDPSPVDWAWDGMAL